VCSVAVIVTVIVISSRAMLVCKGMIEMPFVLFTLRSNVDNITIVSEKPVDGIGAPKSVWKETAFAVTITQHNSTDRMTHLGHEDLKFLETFAVKQGSCGWSY